MSSNTPPSAAESKTDKKDDKEKEIEKEKEEESIPKTIIKTKTEISSVVVHPLVLLSTVDHYTRVAAGTNKRVVGVLLGETYKGKVDITNSYAVPFEEDRRDPNVWFLDHNYHEAMYDMFKKVNAKEKVVGWYSTGPKIRPADIEINELFRKYTKDPILVIINVAPTDDITLPTEAYRSIDTQDEEKSERSKTFQHIHSEIGAHEPEEIGVEHLLRDVKDKTVSTLSSRIVHKVASLKGLKKHVGEMQKYLENVCANKLPANPKIIYLLQDIFNLSPNLRVKELVTAFAVKGNDMMLVIYLSSMIRSILALHNLINNHEMNKEAEIESKESKREKKKKRQDRELTADEKDQPADEPPLEEEPPPDRTK